MRPHRKPNSRERPAVKHIHKIVLSTLLTVFASGGILPPASNAGVKSGSFMNPITDVAWQEVFPIKIAGLTLLDGGNYDVPDVASFPICICPAPPPLMFRIGIPVSFLGTGPAYRNGFDPVLFPISWIIRRKFFCHQGLSSGLKQ